MAGRVTRRSTIKVGLAGLGALTGSFLPALVPSAAAQEWEAPDREENSIGGIHFDQPEYKAFGWKVKVEESDDVLYDIVATNVAPFNDPAFPNDHTPRPIRIVRAQPRSRTLSLVISGTVVTGLWSIEGYYPVPVGESLVARNLRFDNDDQFFIAQMHLHGAWLPYDASPRSALSTVQFRDNRNTLRIVFGGTQPFHIDIKRHGR